MRHFALGIAPTLLVAFGLYAAHSVLLTFVLFYIWLGAVPFLDGVVFRKQSLTQAINDWGLTANARQSLIGFGLGMLVLTVLLLGAYYFHDTLFDSGRLASLLEKWHFSGDHSVLLLFVLVMLNPLLEEIYWRGYLGSKIGNPDSAKSLLAASFWFTAYHLIVLAPAFNWPLNVLACIPIYAAGVLWGWIRHRTKSLLAPMISHMLADLGIVIVYMLYVR